MRKVITIALSIIFLFIAAEHVYGATSEELQKWICGDKVGMARDGYDCMTRGYGCEPENLNWILTDSSDCSSYLDLLRARSEYIGEDADYIYMKASIGNTTTYSLELDPNGTHMFGVPIDLLEDWIATGCRKITP